MLKKFNNLFERLVDYLIYKSLKKKFKKYSKNYPNIAGRVFDIIPLKIKLFGRFEKDELATLKECIFDRIESKKYNALDIGANIGNHSLFFSEHFLNVYSFEPLSINFELLKINSLNKDNIKIFKFGASDKDEIKYIVSTFDIDPGHSQIIEDVEKFKDFKSEKVQTKNLDNFLGENNVSKIKFIKIDVEGFEFRVLKGLKNTIISEKPIIAFEQFPEDFSEGTTLAINFLKENNYKYFYEPIFKERKKSDNKLISACYKLLFVLQNIFTLQDKNSYSLRRVANFSIKTYPMIIASYEEIL